MSDLPAGWEVRFSKSRDGKPYYFAKATGESVWEKPALPPAAPPTSSVAMATSEVRVSHLLVKHAGSRRPSSWRCASITLSKAEAIAKLQGFEAAIRAKASSPAALAAAFAELAGVESDCSSAAKGGDLGFFGRGAMQKPFEDASFALAVGQMSGVVDTDSGVHIILRVA